MSLPRHIFNHSIIWLVLPVVVVLALYVSVGRYFFPLLENYRNDIVLWANEQLTLDLQIEHLDGQWNDFDPYIRLDQIAIFAPDTASDQAALPAIEVDRFSLELDSLNSFRYRFPVIRQASIEGVTLRLNQDQDASWNLHGWSRAQAKSASDSGDQASPVSENRGRNRERIREDVAPITRLLEFLLRQQHLKMEHVWLELKDRYGREYRAYSSRLEVQEVKGKRRLQGQLQLNPETAQQIGFIMEISGDPFDQSTLEVELYLNADSQSLTSWLEKISHLLPFDLPQLEGGLELWSTWQGGRLQNLKGRLEQGALKLNLPEQPEITVSGLNSAFFLQRDQGGWSLIADQLQFTFQQQFFDLSQLVFKKADQIWQAQIADLDLKSISTTLLGWPDLPADARDALERLQPKGHLHNLTLSQSPEQGFLLKTDIDAVSVDAYYGAPVLRNVSGYVETSSEKGYIRFTSDEFFMGYPELYSGGWWFDRARGEVHWEIGDALRVYGLGLQLNRGATEIAGEFDLQQPKNADDLFYLNVGLTNAEETFGLTLVPDLIIPADLNQWLETSIRSTQVKKGGFIYDGTLNLEAESPVRQIATLLLLDVEQGNLAFMPDWPEASNLNAQVRLDGSELDVDLRSGRYLNNDGISGQVTLRDDGKSSLVGLALKGRLMPEWGWEVFTRTPLKDQVPESLHHWRLSGQPMDLTTNLVFPVDGRRGKGSVDIVATDNSLQIPELGTPINKFRGQVRYDIDQGLVVKGGEVAFLGGPAHFNIHTDMSRGAVIVSGSGRVSTEAISQWQSMPVASWLQGELDYIFNLDLDRISRLYLTSDLQNVSVALPDPLGKEVDIARPFELEMSFSAPENRFVAAYGDPLSENFLVSHGIWGGAAKGYGTGIWYGRSVADAGPLGVRTGRTDVYIDQPQIKIDPWIGFAEQEHARHSVISSVSGSGVAVPDVKKESADPVRVHLFTDRLLVKDSQIADLTIDAELSGQALNARFVSQQLEGAARITPALVVLDMKRVFIQEPSDQKKEKMTKADRRLVFEQIFKPAWPDFDLNIDEFLVFDVSGQKLDARYRTSKDSRQLLLNNLSQGSIQFSGTLDWLSPDAESLEPQTSLILNVKGGNLKDVQTSFGIPTAVTSEKTDSGLRLNWKGLPHDVHSETLSGQVTLNLEKGQFEQAQSVPALKLLSLFNFESVVRRLQLDFSDLSGKGLSYDKVTGRVELKEGIGTVVEPIKVDGTATKFELTGKLDFVDEKFDQEMVVTLPVGETLPFAAILAGAPQVGGTIYIVQKVFGNLFEKFTRATYTIKGDWAEPQIELKRVF